jgi:putative RNA 2'-phosphotransferase
MRCEDAASKRSKFLSLVLRHRPELIGIRLDENGWVDVDVLLVAIQKNGRGMTRAELEETVRSNNKQRFAFSSDGLRVRANQGHSVEVDLGLEPQTPPNVLYHGTTDRFLESIWKAGLQKRKRHHVHLSCDPRTATAVGQRHGRPVILKVDAARMHADGLKFYCSANGVWLTDEVPMQYIEFPCAG